MRVGYLSAAPRVSTRDDAEASGPRAHVVGVIRALEELGSRVEPFVVGDHMPKMVRSHSEETLRSAPWKRLGADLLRIGLGTINARRAWSQLGSKVDWVYERAAALQSLGWIFRRRGIPWILETSAPFFHEAKLERHSLVLGELARARELVAYRECDVIVAVSRALRDVLVDAGIDPAKIVVMPNGVDPTVFDPDRHSMAPRHFGVFTVGFVGSLIGWQGVDLLLKAIAVLRSRGIEVAAAIAGDGPALGSLVRQVQELGLKEHVTFAGRLPGTAIPRFIAGADVGYSGQRLLQIGTMYHSPLKLYEYLAMGKPVIASAFEDARASIEEGRTGFLFRQDDCRDLERALTEAHANQGRLVGMGVEARRVVREHHTWRARIQTMLLALERI